MFDVAATDLLKVGETPSWDGGCLTYMAVDPATRTSGLYYNSPAGSSKYGDTALGEQFTVDTPSAEAQDDDKATKLWDLTAKLLDVPTTII